MVESVLYFLYSFNLIYLLPLHVLPILLSAHISRRTPVSLLASYLWDLWSTLRHGREATTTLHEANWIGGETGDS